MTASLPISASQRSLCRPRALTVSIIIKALNEERNIASAIESALAAVREIDAEVILADGGSTDRTIEIARRYPIVIVQLNRTEDRSCGSGAQLGFQYSRGHYLMLMDGDMRLDPEFLPVAINMLKQDPRLAAIGGTVFEPEIVNEEYEQRQKRADRHGPVTRLDGSGLYRRAAIESLGYLTDRNLHGCEEFDLGARLFCKGWDLLKIKRTTARHELYRGNAYRMWLGYIRSKRASWAGELFRAAIGGRYLVFAMRNNRQWITCLITTGWWITLLATILFSSALAAVTLLLLPFAAMSLRSRSLRLGVYSVFVANVATLFFWPGFFRSRKPPAGWIESTVLQTEADFLGARPGTQH
jgi:glycosyltransferase involved in cell wall biosynthesis